MCVHAYIRAWYTLVINTKYNAHTKSLDVSLESKLAAYSLGILLHL